MYEQSKIIIKENIDQEKSTSTQDYRKHRIMGILFNTIGNLFPAFGTKVARKLLFTPRKRKIREEFEYLDKQSTIMNIPFKDGFLKVREWGSGSTILLVHGWNANWSHFGKLIPVLLNQGYRVVAYDAPAHGESSGKETNIVEMSNALLAIKNEIGEIYAVVGHSLGGATTALALKRGLNVPKVVLSAPPMSIKQVIDIYSSMLYLPNKIKQRLYSETEKRIEHTLDEVSAYSFAHNMQIPLLLFHDVNDEYVPYESSQHLAKIWKGTKFVSTQGLGHRRLLWNSDVHQQIMGFLK
ncbi:MAG: alpha/beta hydrolase [Candidatus Heimdallarchaeota archaeon]|nr:alpha/beta hydrolase [Candidatus Heimdallarchaeota archaeon]